MYFHCWCWAKCALIGNCMHMLTLLEAQWTIVNLFWYHTLGDMCLHVSTFQITAHLDDVCVEYLMSCPWKQNGCMFEVSSNTMYMYMYEV